MEKLKGSRTIACEIAIDRNALSGRTCLPQGGAKVGRVCGNGADCQQAAAVLPVRQNSIAILEPLHRPTVLLPLQDTLPVLAVAAAIDSYAALEVPFAGLDPGGKKNPCTGGASVNGRTMQVGNHGSCT